MKIKEYQGGPCTQKADPANPNSTARLSVPHVIHRNVLFIRLYSYNYFVDLYYFVFVYLYVVLFFIIQVDQKMMYLSTLHVEFNL